METRQGFLYLYTSLGYDVQLYTTVWIIWDHVTVLWIGLGRMNLVSGEFRDPMSVLIKSSYCNIHSRLVSLTCTIDDPAEYLTAILAELSSAVQAGKHACETATLARLTKMRVSSSKLLQE